MQLCARVSKHEPIRGIKRLARATIGYHLYRSDTYVTILANVKPSKTCQPERPERYV